jgi:hypothetical protein
MNTDEAEGYKDGVTVWGIELNDPVESSELR